MPEKYIFDDNTSSNLVIRLFNMANACEESHPWYNKYKDTLFKDMVKGSFEDPEFRPGWIMWFFKRFYSDISPNIRKKLLEHIKDAMQNFKLYTELENIENEDEVIVLNKFKGKLPQAEKELQVGMIKRAKKFKGKN